MMRLTCAAATIAALMVFAPAVGAKPGNGNSGEHANGGSSEAAKVCAAQKKADKDAFKALWGKHAMRECIRAGRSSEGAGTVAEQTAEFANAAQECRAEHDVDAAAFAATYGTNGNDKNAFGKCVSTKVHGDEAPKTAPSS